MLSSLPVYSAMSVRPASVTPRMTSMVLIAVERRHLHGDDVRDLGERRQNA
jgi:hypothetical protein